ncbi:MAG: glycosyltransferase family 4 protein [Thermoanaerobaculia bacterium]
MHVLLIHQAFAGPNEPGGTRHWELASRALGKGHRFTVVASDASYLTGRAAEAGEENATPGLRIVRVRTLRTLHRSFAWRVAAFLGFMVTSTVRALAVRKVDLVFGTSPPIFQAVSAWLASALKRVPFVLEIRDLWPEFAVDMGVLTNPALVRLARWLEAFLYARADLLVVNSPAYRDYLLRRGIPGAKVRFVPNGVDASMFDPAARGEGLRREWGCDGKSVALYAGAIGPANDIPTLLGAAEMLKDEPGIAFVLVGDGKDRPKLEEAARAKGLANVRFAGTLPKRRMPEALAACDVGVAILKDIPMFRTTYPNKVFDYMAAGRPTVLAIDGVIRAVVEEADGGTFVPPGNAAALAQAVKAMAADPARRASMGASARAFVESHFNRDDQAELFVRSLEEALEGGARVA